jgi:hypothetical protein
VESVSGEQGEEEVRVVARGKFANGSWLRITSDAIASRGMELYGESRSFPAELRFWGTVVLLKHGVLERGMKEVIRAKGR